MSPTVGNFFRRFAKALLYCFTALPLALPAAHSSSSFLTQLWQTDEGLPHNHVRAIAQTRDGYLWIGTQKGLVRFDGLQFKLFDEPQSPELKNATITALLATKDGGLWIGTANG